MSVFNEHQFEKRLQSLKDSQDSIQSLSAWCLQHRQHHKKIVACWLRILKKGKFLCFQYCNTFMSHFGSE
ncbi:hypothetical protein Cfor_01369 [Coptotermes formosanus]|uniref:CID domain-containing protein n=1 Tax=Coptotermes formosanus TaxID=36987 RepID=A0A6L2PVW7_COPFO|nr:hypothetical protein Cfor_01369 [Coptotermes formosanus]